MSNQTRTQFLGELVSRFGPVHRLEGSQSLYDVANGALRLYIRYSKRHGNGHTFFGLRADDLQQLENRHSMVCFLWDDQESPLLIPYSRYSQIFQSVSPAKDGQYKTQIYLYPSGTQMYVSRAGRHGVDSYYGWQQIEQMLDGVTFEVIPDLTHSQLQTLLGSIGNRIGCDVWIPLTDRSRLDWSVTERFDPCNSLPESYERVRNVLQEIDVVWIKRGSSQLHALFEIEYSTPIYSGLLRLNDVHLISPNLASRFTVVSDAERRRSFVRQLERPTFVTSSLNKICEFMDYQDVYRWHHRTGDVLRTSG